MISELLGAPLFVLLNCFKSLYFHSCFFTFLAAISDLNPYISVEPLYFGRKGF